MNLSAPSIFRRIFCLYIMLVVFCFSNPNAQFLSEADIQLGRVTQNSSSVTFNVSAAGPADNALCAAGNPRLSSGAGKGSKISERRWGYLDTYIAVADLGRLIL